jgi:hypothetical protein
MTADGSWHGAVPHMDQADDAKRAVEEAQRAATDEWGVLLRPRHSRRDYARQIVLDVAVVVVALVIIALLS